jgi:Bacterial antitoxin of type II TA system, VapB
MKKTLRVDQTLLSEAKKACGATTDTETVRRGLEALNICQREKQSE